MGKIAIKCCCYEQKGKSQGEKVKEKRGKLKVQQVHPENDGFCSLKRFFVKVSFSTHYPSKFSAKKQNVNIQTIKFSYESKTIKMSS